MAPRTISPEGKQKKRQYILDAAESLWQQHPNSITCMSDLAKKAGMAKGTLYLYFNSKEEIFLALHERHIADFFHQLKALAETTESLSADTVVASFRHFIEGCPAFLPLASLTHGLLERQIPLEVGIEFKARISLQMEDLVSVLQRHFPHLTLMVMSQSYGLLLGLWQFLRPTALNELVCERDLYLAEVDGRDYLDVAEDALIIIWNNIPTSENKS